MNQSQQSFCSSTTQSKQHTSRLETEGAQIRNLTISAEARQQAIKQTLLQKKAAMEALKQDLQQK